MQLHPPTRPRSPRMYGSYAPPPHPPPATQPEEPTFSLSVYAEFEATGPEKKLVREIFSLTMGTSNPAELDDPSAILLGDLAVPLFETTGLPMLVLGEVWNVADEVCGGFLTRNGVALALRMMGWAQFDMDEGKPFAVDVGDVVRLEWLRPDGPMPHLDALSDRPNPHRKEPKFLPSKRPPAQPEYVRVHSHTPPPIPSPTLRSATPVTKTAAVALGHAAFPHGHHHEQSGSSISTPLASSSTIPSNSFTHKQPVDTFDTISDALIGLSFDWKPAPRRADSNSTTNATSPSSRFSMLSTSLEKGKWKPLELRTDQVESADPFADPGAASSSAVKLRAVSSSSSTIEPISQHSSALPESYSTPLAAQPAPVAVPKFDVSPPPRSSSTEDDDIRAARAKYPGLVPSPVPFSRGPAIPEGSRLSDDKLKLMYPELPSRPTSTSPPVISPISNVVVPTPNLMAPEVAPTAESSLPLITAVQRTKYLGLWRNAGGKGENDDERLDGDSCRAVFMKSRLGFGLLGRVWDLATNSASDDQEMRMHEFIVAMYLIDGLMSKNIQISDLPKRLSTQLQDSARLNHANDINHTRNRSHELGRTAFHKPLHQRAQHSRNPPQHCCPLWWYPTRPRQLRAPLTPSPSAQSDLSQPLLVSPQSRGAPSPFLNPRSVPQMPVPRPTRLPTPDERAARAFARLDVLSQGEIGGGTLLPFFMDSGIPVHSLAEIWDKADANVDGSLTLEEFTLAYKLILDQRPTFDPASAIPVDTADSQLISWDGSSPGARHSIYVAPDSLLDEDHEEQQQLARLQARPAPSLPVDRPVSRLEERPLPPTPPPMVGTANLARREMDLPALPVPSQYNQDNATIALRLMVPEVLSIEDDELPPLPASPIPRSASGSSIAHRRTTSTSPAGRSPIASPSPSRHQRSQSARVPSSSPSSGSPVAQGSPQPSSQVRRSATTAAGRLSPGGADVDVRRSMHEVALETVLPPDLPAETEPPPAYTAQLGAGEQAMEVRFS